MPKDDSIIETTPLPISAINPHTRNKKGQEDAQMVEALRIS